MDIWEVPNFIIPSSMCFLEKMCFAYLDNSCFVILPGEPPVPKNHPAIPPIAAIAHCKGVTNFSVLSA